MTRVVYLDHHATTPVDDRVLEVMVSCLRDTFGNPASRTHRWGWEAAAAVSESRTAIAGALGAHDDEILFTSGATESINLALLGLAARHPERDHIVATAVEHRAVLDTLQALAHRGLRVDLLPVDEYGCVSAEQVAAALTPRTLCACTIYGQNEIGSLNPVEEIAAACRKRGVFTFVDASQAIGHIPVNVAVLGVDLLAFSAHKFHGPKGTGVLYVREDVLLAPVFHGGGHERGLRPGTLNVPAIVGMAAALGIAVKGMNEESARISGLRNDLQQGLLAAIPSARVNGHPDRRLPGNLNMSFSDVDAEAVLIALTDIALSTGSACTSAKLEPSHVLRAIGLTDDEVRGSIRFGLGRGTTAEDVAYTIGRLSSEIGRLRQLSPSWVVRQRRSVVNEVPVDAAEKRDPALAAVRGERY